MPSLNHKDAFASIRRNKFSVSVGLDLMQLGDISLRCHVYSTYQLVTFMLADTQERSLYTP